MEHNSKELGWAAAEKEAEKQYFCWPERKLRHMGENILIAFLLNLRSWGLMGWTDSVK